MSHSPSFTGVFILVCDCEDVVSNWLPEVGIEVCFADVGFGRADALDGRAGVECQTVGAVADYFTWCVSASSYVSSPKCGTMKESVIYHMSRDSGRTLDVCLLSMRGTRSRNP
jgi:hypothetical protein